MKFFLFLAFSLIFGICNAQNIIANFVAPATCPNERTYFSDLSIAQKGTIISWQWHFGDGNQSQVQHPKHKYINSGKYNVKLIITDDLGETDSISKEVLIYDPPGLKFSINALEQCFNSHNFNFYNETKDSMGLNFIWALGDGNLSNTNGILNKTYTDTGTYLITLKGISKDNCIDSIRQSIKIFSSPKADFTYYGECTLNLTYFTSANANIDDVFKWNFNNETSSTKKNPTAIFVLPGDKRVTFTITNIQGCKDSIQKLLKIKVRPRAIFISNDVCEYDSAVFINKSTDATHYKWKFMDGGVSTEESPKYLFQNKGFIANTLVAYNVNGCKDSATQYRSVISRPNSGFTFTHKDYTIIFTAKQAGNNKYRWLFGDGDSATGYTVNHIYKENPEGKTICLKLTTTTASCVSETCQQLWIWTVKNIHTGSFKMFPNPSNGIIKIEIENPEKDMSIEIYNSLGELVEKLERAEKVNNLELDLTNGIYRVVVNGNNVSCSLPLSVIK